MTDEFSYHGEPEIQPTESTDDWQHEEPTAINLSESHFCVLKRHDMLRIVREAGLRELVVLVVIKLHCDASGACWVSPWTISRLSGCRDMETLQGYINKLIRIAVLERITIRGKDGFRVIGSDAPPKPYVLVHRAWIEHYIENRDIWSVCSKTLWERGTRRRGRRPAADQLDIGHGLTPTAAAVLWLMQSRGRTFNAKADELAAECGLSRDQFLQIANLLRDYGLIAFRRAGNGTLWTTDFTRPRLSEKSGGASPRLSEKSCQEVDVKLIQEQVDVVPKSKTGSKQDQRRAENRADAAATIPTFSPQVQSPPPTAASRDTKPTHENCECNSDHFIEIVDEKGRTRYTQCQRWLAWAKWQKAEQARELELAPQRKEPFGFDFRDIVLNMMPALPPARMIEGEWHDETPAPPPKPRANPRAVITGKTENGEFLFNEFRRTLAWHAVGRADLVIGARTDSKLPQKVNAMLGALAGVDIDDFDDALGNEMLDRYNVRLTSGKEVLDMLGRVIYTLTDDERFGRHDSGTPNAVYEETYAA